MSNESYWEQRQVQDMFHYMGEAENKADEIANLYLKASRYMSLQAEDIFEKYRTKYGLSESEARRLINTLQDKTSLNELLQKLASCNDSHEKDELRKQLEAPAYQARLERIQQLQNQLDRIMKDIYQQEVAVSKNFYVDLANEAYYRNMFNIQQRANVAFGFAHVSEKQIETVLNSKWSGENYSERIWGNTRALAQDLKEELLINLVTGRTNREVANIIANKFAQGASNARRLVRTESAFLSTELNFKAYNEAGIKEYKYLATLDLRTSKVCRELDGKRFRVKDRKVGVNAPPMHPWCRSTTVAAFSDDLTKGKQRSAIDPTTGKQILVPAGMTYEQWYEKYVKGKPEVEAAEKAEKYKSSDRKQHEKYREILGDNIPERLADFQNMKYNEHDKWKFTKLAYSRQKELIDHPELKLPNADTAMAPDAKFEKYLFGGEHKDGLIKGENIRERLGYDMSNWKKFRAELLDGATKYPVKYKDNNGYGDRFEQKQILFGKTNNPTNVVVGWIVKADGTTSMSSAYIKEV